ncbi:MAG: AMP-binding protein [Corynebacterium sp.]|nr:AMP-binding protein [Corynebacterium sp.]
MRLHALPVDSPTLVDDIERCLSGSASWCPVPAGATARGDALRASMRFGEDIEPDIALVMATSGSTGTPKGALLTAGNLVASADATHRVLGGPKPWLTCLPVHTIAGMQTVVRTLVAGFEPVIMDVSHGFAAEEFIALTEPDTYTSLVPNQLHTLLHSLAGVEALQQYAGVLVGGAAIPKDLKTRAERLGIRLITTYGASETAGGCVYDGVPIPGAQIAFSGDDGVPHVYSSHPAPGAGADQSIPEGARIWLGGPMVARGYRNDTDNLNPGPDGKPSRGELSTSAFPRPGWFATSDSGTISAGKLTVLGRFDTLINSGGLKLHPELLEHQILQVPGVDEVCVVGLPDPKFGQIIAAAYTGSATPAHVIEGLADLPRWQLPKELRRLDTLPTLTSGKVDRMSVEAKLARRGG